MELNVIETNIFSPFRWFVGPYKLSMKADDSAVTLPTPHFKKFFPPVLACNKKLSEFLSFFILAEKHLIPD